jgi:uncharacterized protein GlcG (DUF336 family)/mannose-6-phosphate isomerase-like protein (cupin superfamily)
MVLTLSALAVGLNVERVQAGEAGAAAGSLTPLPPQIAPEYGSPISLAQAKRLAALVAGEAAKVKADRYVLAIVQPSGELVYFEKADNSTYVSIDYAQQKARMAARYRTASGGLPATAVGLSDAISLTGGMPIVYQGKTIGGIGISGISGGGDVRISELAAKALDSPGAVVGAAAEVKTFASAAEMVEMVKRGDAATRAKQAFMGDALLKLAPYQLNLEYRTSTGTAAIHETDAELFYVLEGSGTVVLGGKMVNELRRNAENLTGSALDGGTARDIAKGDVFVVREGEPHWFSKVDRKLILMSLHLPRPVPGR